MEYIKIGEVEYPAQISGRVSDTSWDGRYSKAITLTMSYTVAAEIFVDGLSWSIICTDEEGGREEFDNSEFNVAGPITDNRDGTIIVKMGKLTDLEEAYEMLFGENV